MELEYSKHMLRTQSSELSLSRTKHEFPFEFRKRIKFPFLSNFEKGNYALKKECFRFRRNNHITHTHTQNCWVYYYTIFLCDFFSAWTGRTTLTASLDMLNDYQALNSSVSSSSTSFFFFFFPSTTCFIFITNHFVHYQHHCPMSSWCCRQDPEANPQKGRDSELKKTHNRNSARNSEIFN